MKKIIFGILLVFSMNMVAVAQYSDPSKVYAFEYDGKTYEIVRVNQKWTDAAATAVASGGYLAEINSQTEQDAVYAALQNASIDNANTVAADGGNASYVWLGGNDISVEGQWVWDGDNDGVSTQFWQGKANGSAVNGAYTNWGNEPDDFNNNQDALGLALTQWPINSGTLGSASQWNDVDHLNTLYFVIEYSGILPVELISFSGKQRGDVVSLSWSTASQVNSKFFSLERARDGIHFEKISKLDIEGDSDVKVDYRFVDLHPSIGINYYRLKIVDLDLTETYSSVLSVDFQWKNRFNVYPNPVQETLTISATSNDLVFALYNFMGQLIFEKKILAQDIDLIFLDKGTYYYLIKDKFGAIIQREQLVKF